MDELKRLLLHETSGTVILGRGGLRLLRATKPCRLGSPCHWTAAHGRVAPHVLALGPRRDVDNSEPMRGGMKDVYFGLDKSYVVAFYRDKQDYNSRERLKKRVTQYFSYAVSTLEK